MSKQACWFEAADLFLHVLQEFNSFFECWVFGRHMTPSMELFMPQSFDGVQAGSFEGWEVTEDHTYRS